MGVKDRGQVFSRHFYYYMFYMEKTYLSGFFEQQGTDQPAHTRSLISAFVITGTVAEQAGLNLTLSEDRVSHATAHIYFTNFPHLYFASISPVIYIQDEGIVFFFISFQYYHFFIY